MKTCSYILIAGTIAVLVVTILVFCQPASRRESYDAKCDDLRVVRLDSGKPGKCVGIVGGVHGNEPSGMVALNAIVASGFKPTTGKLVLIPEANQCGLRNKVRHQPSSTTQSADINRNYTSEGGTDFKSREILSAFRSCDLVIDLHEAWGYYRTTPPSVGSTLTPTSDNLSVSLARKAVERLNVGISNPDKKFEVLQNQSCRIGETLGCHMEQNKRPYILVETTGQKDVQPLPLRVAQVKTILSSILSDMGLIAPEVESLV